MRGESGCGADEGDEFFGDHVGKVGVGREFCVALVVADEDEGDGRDALCGNEGVKDGRDEVAVGFAVEEVEDDGVRSAPLLHRDSKYLLT